MGQTSSNPILKIDDIGTVSGAVKDHDRLPFHRETVQNWSQLNHKTVQFDQYYNQLLSSKIQEIYQIYTTDENSKILMDKISCIVFENSNGTLPLCELCQCETVEQIPDRRYDLIVRLPSVSIHKL